MPHKCDTLAPESIGAEITTKMIDDADLHIAEYIYISKAIQSPHLFHVLFTYVDAIAVYKGNTTENMLGYRSIYSNF